MDQELFSKERVLQWANNYYRLSLGLSDKILEVDDKITEEYVSKFLSPLSYIKTGDKDKELTIGEFIETFNSVRLAFVNNGYRDWLHLLSPLVSNKYLIYNGNMEEDLQDCIDNIEKILLPAYITTGLDSKDTKIHVLNSGNFYDIPVKYVKYDRSLRVTAGGNLLKELLKKRYQRLRKPEIRTISKAVKLGLIKTDDVQQVTFFYPKTKEKITVPMTDTRVPPPEYFEILNESSPHYFNEDLDEFEQISDIANKMTIGKDLQEYLNSYKTNKELNDEEVLSYLRKRGVEVDSIDDLMPNSSVPTILEGVYDDEVLDMNVSDFMNSIKSNNTQMIELDEYIQRYCLNNGISLKCTVAQLLQSISYGSNPEPLTNKDTVAQIVAEEKLNQKMTLEDYIRGWKYTPPDPVDTVLDYILDNPLFPDGMEDLIRNTVLKDVPLTKEILKSSIYVEEEKVTSLDEEGYIVGEYILQEARKELSKDSTYSTRENLTPLVYCFLRCLMGDFIKEKNAIIDTLKKYHDSSNGKAKEILERALILLN